MEIFKDIVASLLSPLSIAVLLLLGSIGALVWRRERFSRRLLYAATVVLIFGSFSGWSYEQRRQREYQYPPYQTGQLQPLDQALLIVVLGGGFNADDFLPANSRVTGAYLARLLEGVRIHREHPESRLVISVAGKADAVAKRKFIDQLALTLALNTDRIDLLTTAESTADEAQLVSQHVQQSGGSPAIALVTSAGHMHRAVGIFEDAGLNVVAAPTDYTCTRAASPDDKPWQRWVPSTGGIGSNHQLLYETAAAVWHRLGGR